MAISQAMLQRILAAKQKNASGSKFLKLETNKTVRFYVLPGEYSAEKLFYYKTAVHYFGDKDKGLCPKETFGEDCPVCEFRIELRQQVTSMKQDVDDMRKAGASSDEVKAKVAEYEAIEELAKKLWPSSRYLLNVLPVGETAPRILSAPKGVWETIFNMYEKNAMAGTDMFDPRVSYQFLVTRVGDKKTNTEYKTEFLLKPLPIVCKPGTEEADDSEITRVLNERANLDDEVVRTPLDELSAMFNKYLDTKAAGSGEAPGKAAPHHEELGAVSTPAAAQVAAAHNISTPATPTVTAPATPAVSSGGSAISAAQSLKDRLNKLKKA